MLFQWRLSLPGGSIKTYYIIQNFEPILNFQIYYLSSKNCSLYRLLKWVEGSVGQKSLEIS